jgi:HlyD family secretion protein
LTPKKESSATFLKRKTPWIITAVLLIAALSGYIYYSRVTAASTQTTDAQTQTEIVRPGDLTVSASGSGTLIAQTDASFGFDTSGQVTEVNVKVGDQVEAGQVLAQLDDTLARMQYDEAQRKLQELYSAASIATIQEEIATAQDTEASAKEWLAYLISPDVAEAEANLIIAQQALTDAQTAAKANPSDAANRLVKEKEQAVTYLNEKLTQAITYYNNVYLPEAFGIYVNVGNRRFPKMALATTTAPTTGEIIPEINAPSVDDLTTARNSIAQAEQTISEGQAYLDILNSGTIPDNAVGDKITTLYEAQLALENAKSALDDTQLTAPISGTVTSLDLSVGEQVEADSDSVITISQLNQPYALDAYIDGTDWSMARVGNKVNVTIKLLPDNTYSGTVTLVYPELVSSFETSVVHLIIQLDRSMSQALPVGTGATVDVIGGEAKNALLVPVDAVHKGDDGKSYVTVVRNGQQVEREITIGLVNDTYAEVIAGLQAGEIVVNG